MFKALFAFKKTHPSSIGFDENEEFIGLPGASTDKNWHYVIDTNGTAGYVPKNYVEKKEVTLEYFKSMAEKIKVSWFLLSFEPLISSKIPQT